MDNDLNSRMEILEREFAAMRIRIEKLEKSVFSLGKDGEEVHADLSQEDFLSNISMLDSDVHHGVVPAEPEKEIPVVSVEEDTQEGISEDASDSDSVHGIRSDDGDVPDDLPPDIRMDEDLPEDMPEGDEGTLFGPVHEDAPEVHRKKLSKPLIDVKAARPAWLTDIPGTPVKDVRSAISLNDRVMFISTLFRQDSMLFQTVVNKINAMSTMETVSDYLSSSFPEWDMNSDTVYRFMMAVRRKIR